MISVPIIKFSPFSNILKKELTFSVEKFPKLLFFYSLNRKFKSWRSSVGRAADL